MADIAAVILAGGEASRLPGKLSMDVGGVPMLVRVYENVRSLGDVYVSAREPAPDVVRSLPCRIVYDRFAQSGPLAGLISAFEAIDAATVLAVAGDAPLFGGNAIAQLRDAWTEGSHAVVPIDRDGRLHPLCALYDRPAFLQHAAGVLENSAAVLDVVRLLRPTYVRLHDPEALRNINTPAEYASLQRRAAPAG